MIPSLLLLFSPTALSEELRVPQDNPSLGHAVAASSPNDIIVIDTSWTYSDGSTWNPAAEDPVTIAHRLTILGEGEVRAGLPPLRVENAEVILQDLELGLGTDTLLLNSTTGSEELALVSLYATGSNLQLINVDLLGHDGVGLYAEESDLSLESADFTDFSAWPAMIVRVTQGQKSVFLTAGSFTDNLAGALRLEGPFANTSASLSARLQSLTFQSNRAPSGADIQAFDVGYLGVYDSSFADGEATVEAGSILAERTDIEVSGLEQRSTFTRYEAPLCPGVLVRDTADDQRLLMNNVQFSEHHATSREEAGGAICLQQANGYISDVQAWLLEAGGGALVAANDGHLTLTDATLWNFSVYGQGGAVHVERVDAALLSHLRVCGGRGTAGGNGTVLSSVDSVSSLNWSVVKDLDSINRPAISANGGFLQLLQNTLTTNSVQSLVHGADLELWFTNNILSNAFIGVQLGGDSLVREESGYNLWHGLDQDSDDATGSLPGAHAVLNQAPDFWSGHQLEDCGSLPYLAPGSPAIDAGSPDLLDRFDGTRSDIGAFGGPDGPDLPDHDEDGFHVSEDCDDFDPSAHEGCDENDEDDDGDGFIPPEDCDNSDPSVYPGADDPPGDGIDQDCDGSDGPDDAPLNGIAVGGLAGLCSAGPSAPALPAALLTLGLILARGRRIRR